MVLSFVMAAHLLNMVNIGKAGCPWNTTPTQLSIFYWLAKEQIQVQMLENGILLLHGCGHPFPSVENPSTLRPQFGGVFTDMCMKCVTPYLSIHSLS